MSKLKAILFLLVILIVTISLAFYYENSYRVLVRFFFKFFQGDKIMFVGKKFHLFASYQFVISFGLYSVILSFLIYAQNKKVRLNYLLLTVLVFFATTMATTFADSTKKIVECTACENGIEKLHYNAINYDFHFVSSQLISLLPLILTYLKNQKSGWQRRSLASRKDVAGGKDVF